MTLTGVRCLGVRLCWQCPVGGGWLLKGLEWEVAGEGGYPVDEEVPVCGVVVLGLVRLHPGDLVEVGVAAEEGGDFVGQPGRENGRRTGGSNLEEAGRLGWAWEET